MDTALLIINSVPFTLSEHDQRRVLRFAPLFDIHAEFPEEGIMRVFGGPNRAKVTQEDLPVEMGYCRLVLELSSKVARWMYFNTGEHCKDTLLSQPDAKIERLSELYAVWKSKGFPE